MKEENICEVIKAYKNIQELLSNIFSLNTILKTSSISEPLNSEDKSNIILKITELLKFHSQGDCILLVRGEKKENLNRKLVTRLNSNDSLYDGLFLVGDKAKNYLEKSSIIPHPIKVIAEVGAATANWIFDKYAEIGGNPIDVQYFKGENNRAHFVSCLAKNEQLIDYYLFGIHTNNSATLVNFISSTRLLNVALSYNNDFVIIFWVPKVLSNFYINKARLKSEREKVKSLGLPILEDSYHPNEDEYAIKGFIPPHYILGAIDIKGNALILNPRLLEKKEDWLTDGFNVDDIRFREFIKTTRYKRYLMLMNNITFQEENL